MPLWALPNFTRIGATNLRGRNADCRPLSKVCHFAANPACNEGGNEGKGEWRGKEGWENTEEG